MLYLIHRSFTGLFLPSSVVPGVCRVPAGSGARQDDAGGLSTSSMLPLKAFKLSSSYLLRNTQTSYSYDQTSSWLFHRGNTHSALFALKKYFSQLPLQSSLFVSYLVISTLWCLDIENCVCWLWDIAVPDFWWLFSCRFRTPLICSSNLWRISERSKLE